MIVQEMLRTSPEKRIKCSTILDALAPYKAFICGIESFTVDRVALYDVLETANRERGSKYPAKSSISGIVNSNNQANLHNLEGRAS